MGLALTILSAFTAFASGFAPGPTAVSAPVPDGFFAPEKATAAVVPALRRAERPEKTASLRRTPQERRRVQSSSAARWVQKPAFPGRLSVKSRASQPNKKMKPRAHVYRSLAVCSVCSAGAIPRNSPALKAGEGGLSGSRPCDSPAGAFPKPRGVPESIHSRAERSGILPAQSAVATRTESGPRRGPISFLDSGSSALPAYSPFVSCFVSLSGRISRRHFAPGAFPGIPRCGRSPGFGGLSGGGDLAPVPGRTGKGLRERTAEARPLPAARHSLKFDLKKAFRKNTAPITRHAAIGLSMSPDRIFSGFPVFF